MFSKQNFNPLTQDDHADIPVNQIFTDMIEQGQGQAEQAKQIQELFPDISQDIADLIVSIGQEIEKVEHKKAELGIRKRERGMEINPWIGFRIKPLLDDNQSTNYNSRPPEPASSIAAGAEYDFNKDLALYHAAMEKGEIDSEKFGIILDIGRMRQNTSSKLKHAFITYILDSPQRAKGVPERISLEIRNWTRKVGVSIGLPGEFSEDKKTYTEDAELGLVLTNILLDVQREVEKLISVEVGC